MTQDSETATPEASAALGQSELTGLVIFLIIYTDKWQVDCFPMEVWSDKEEAEERLKVLNKRMGIKVDTYFYELKEIRLNTKAAEERDP